MCRGGGSIRPPRGSLGRAGGAVQHRPAARGRQCCKSSAPCGAAHAQCGRRPWRRARGRRGSGRRMRRRRRPRPAMAPAPPSPLSRWRSCGCGGCCGNRRGTRPCSCTGRYWAGRPGPVRALPLLFPAEEGPRPRHAPRRVAGALWGLPARCPPTRSGPSVSNACSQPGTGAPRRLRCGRQSCGAWPPERDFRG